MWIALEGVVGNVQASSASGDIQAIRLSGQNFKGTSQSGDVSLKETSIPVISIETVSGDAESSGLTGRSLKVRAVSGDVFVKDTAFDEETRLDTVSGFLSLEPRGPLSAGNIGITTVSGDAELKLPKATDATIDINTKGGDVNAKFIGGDGTEKTLQGSGMFAVSETIGKGAGGRISLSSVSGDLTVSQETATVELS
jgi:lia operon protein LiaG